MAKPNLQIINTVDTHILMLKIAGTEVKSFLAITRKVDGEDNWLLYNRFTYLVYGEGTFAEVTKQANDIFMVLVRGLLLGEIFKLTSSPNSFAETYAKEVEGVANYVCSSKVQTP